MKTYGRLLFGNHQGRICWGIDCLEPHVATAFKRLFPKVRNGDIRHILTDTDETRADIKWFTDRYPLDCKPEVFEILAEGADRLAQRLADREAVMDLNWTAPDTPGAFRSKPPYFYQEQAAQIALSQGGLLLGDDVGLGKTISTFTCAARGAPMPMLVVCQSHLTRQWAAKCEEFTTFRSYAIRSSTPYTLPDADIYVISYNMLSGWVPVFTKGWFKSVVYDEIQELRHGTTTAKGRAARILSDFAEFKLGLTATPIYNYGDEIHTVMSYVNDVLLGERDEFLREWCGAAGTVSDPDALGSFLADSGWFLRRDEDHPSVDRSMPRPNIMSFEMDFDQIALAKEEDLLRKLATTVMTGGFTEAGRAARDLDVKMRHLTGVAKAKPVAAYVDMLLKESPRVLLAGWHRDVYDIWRYKLAKYDPVLYTGSETAAGKNRNVQRFMDPKGSRVMMISLRSGAGLDGLQFGCHDAVFGELDWSPKVHYQLLGRLRRPGQKKQVNGHYLHVNGGSDPVLMSMLGVKEDQSRGILDPGQAVRQVVTDTSRVKKLAQHVLEKVG